MALNRTHRVMSRKPLWLACALVALFVFSPQVAWAADSTFAGALEKGWLWAYLFAFGVGFLTSLTPCVYPMIPITVAVFGARDESVTRRKAFALATCYVLGIAVLYSVLGTAFAMAGKTTGAGELLGNPYLIVPLSILFVALAAAMFGFYELQLPSSLQNKLNTIGGKGYGGAFAMGLVGGIIAAPCTGPPLLAILTWVSTTQQVAAGASLLFVYALGMGVLFWVLAVSAAALPKSGRWMEGVKSFFGVIMVVAAIYFLGNLHALKTLHYGDPRTPFLLGTILVTIIGVALGAIHLSFHSGTAVKVRKLFGVLLMVVGVSGFINWIQAPDRILDWRESEAAAFADAKDQNKHVLIDFGAEWCNPCKQIEKIMGTDAVYDDIANNFVPLKIDLTEISDEEEELQEKYSAETLPAVLFVDADGNELARYDNKSPSAESFLSKVREVADENPVD